jgi:hypothetical protein
MLEWLQGAIDSSVKLYLLRGRRELQKDQRPTQATSCMRHYLTLVKTPRHREAIASLLLSTHLLTIEALRYVDHATNQFLALPSGGMAVQVLQGCGDPRARSKHLYVFGRTG